MTANLEHEKEHNTMEANESVSSENARENERETTQATTNAGETPLPYEATSGAQRPTTCSLKEALERRHSVRSYTEAPIEGEVLAALRAEIDACNRESGLNIQLVLDEPQAFSGMMARYGSFRNVRNYVALVGKKSGSLDETVGYWGERVVLAAQRLGLNTCWVALTFSKRKTQCTVGADEKLVCVLSLGYGATQGKPRKSKALTDVCRAEGPLPAWFERGVQAALAAPTAMNQQKFRFELQPDGKTVRAQAPGGAYTAVDLGIAKYHFEIGAGTENFAWA